MACENNEKDNYQTCSVRAGTKTIVWPLGAQSGQNTSRKTYKDNKGNPTVRWISIIVQVCDEL